MRLACDFRLEVEIMKTESEELELDYSVLPNAENLRKARKAKRWSQETLAAKCVPEIHKRTVEAAEKGKRKMKEILARMALALGVPIETLITSEAAVLTQEMLEAVPLPIFFKDASGIY